MYYKPPFVPTDAERDTPVIAGVLADPTTDCSRNIYKGGSRVPKSISGHQNKTKQ